MMHWSGYEVFSVLSGLMLMVLAIVDGDAKVQDRFWCAVCGVLLGGYGIYVAMQSEGTYYFSAYVFVLPVVFGIKYGYKLYERSIDKSSAAAVTSPSSQEVPFDDA